MPGAHALNVARPDHRADSHTIFVLESPFQNDGNDFHVPMRVSGKPCARPDPILVQHAQGAEMHEFRVVEVVERKCMVAFEPVDLRMTAVPGASWV